MTKLSDSQRVILSAAAQHEMGLARAPKTLPAAARNAVFRSLIKNNLLTEINAPREHVGLGWRQDDDGTWIVARITDEGLRAIGIDPNEGDAVAGERDTAPTVAPHAERAAQDATVAEAAQAAPLTEEIALLDQALAARVATPRANLRDTAAAILAAWDDQAARFGTHDGDLIGALDAPIATLRATLAGKPTRAPRDANTPRKPREGTKQEQVLAMLRRPEGATVAQIAEATGWNSNTVRGFFAGLKKKGHAVEVMERVRQVGPNKEGARGSYTVYRIGG
ncbi:DUF3489 domain-containing protein [Sediminicoccus rosea]|uniref:DUF3489 domain-containing protein n=1 Tax=Sediminicoccus rosea TaxID=1225128 RepID=A0ABZ0PET9_9PROT|nr:DUF3489 domain-containing protein [Sediminicoccus rosea]WPB83695.1 DUF3489 domain-containing protein [Sediminicoccus rosea]